MFNLTLANRVLTRQWALRRETLIALTQGILSEHTPRKQAGTMFPVFRTYEGENEDGEIMLQGKRLATTPGYTILNWQGLQADLRGNLPPVPLNTHVILVWGCLGRGWSCDEMDYFNGIEVDELIAAINARPPTERIVLWFRSPGGIVTGIPETALTLRTLAIQRSIDAFTDDCCASAAYWLAAQCRTIAATPTAEVGSIGVYLALYDYTEYLKQNGIKLELFKEGDLKAIGLVGNPLDDKARAYLQQGVTEANALFRQQVTEMRVLAEETMQGQTLNGPAAQLANLIDSQTPSAAAYLR